MESGWAAAPRSARWSSWLPRCAPPAHEAAAANIEQATDLVQQSFEYVASNLRTRAAQAESTVAAVLEATSLMAQDPGLLADVLRRMATGVGPATAVDQAVEGFCSILEMSGGYMAERVTDLRDVRDRIVAQVLGQKPPGLPQMTEPSVVVAADLAPADTATLDLDHVVAIVTELGGPTSHTAIIAAQLDLPCVVRTAGALELVDGDIIAVDAAHGTVVKDPDDSLREAILARASARAALKESSGGPGKTKDGQAVQLLANIGKVEDAEKAAKQDLEGVGLFRTEVLFLDSKTAPSVETQVKAYTKVFQAFGDRKVVVRTLDAGADKPLAFAPSDEEENPALGVRGLRMDRRYPQLLDDQLTAIAQAAKATGAKVWVMAPMVATVHEAQAFEQRVKSHDLPVGGIMIEVPAAALRAPHLIEKVDFFSIGTNDLTQYAMATDRMAGELAELLDPWQPAVLDLIAMAGAAGKAADKPVGVCGEAARDPLLALVLVGLGITSLSMAPNGVPAVRYALARTTTAQCEELAAAARGAIDAAAARSAVEALVDPEILLAL
ncbi:phosphoenolpyruvate--protein phosphotransferase [Nakamurella multipartita]|uniref:phosphoenolpyruvate--protein phosphotransferase n=1 Tax=Nakamurella multipartita TaxID=53461 RepID=UPI000A03AB7E|nr:phosphoenolpyruvate--protein phosphotransferase [Nakamurella multipartita]